MKLRDLQAYFTRYVECAVDPTVFVDGVMHPDGIERSYHRVELLAEADGVWFKCPKCFGTEHPHRVNIGFRGRCPPGSYTKGSDGQDTRWDLSLGSSGLDDLVLTPSIQSLGGCEWHGFVGSSGVPPGEAA